MTQTSFYGDTPNFATDYPTQNDGAPTTGNTPAPSSFYPNGGGYVPLAIADDVLAEAQALVAQADTDAANAASSAAVAAASATSATASAAAAAASASFTQSGSGAVTRTTNSKLSELLVSVTDFGAQGDGSTDDTAAIQAAVNAVITAGRGRVHFPRTASFYKTSSQITIDLSSYGTRFASRVHLTGDGPGASAIVNNTFGGAVLKYIGKASNIESYFKMDGLRLSGNAVAGSIGLQMNLAAWPVFRDVVIEGFETGFDNTDVEQAAFYDCTIRYNSKGITFHGAAVATDANSITFVNCAIGNNSIYGVQANRPNAFTFIGGSIQYNGTVGGGAGQYGIKLIDAGNGGAYGTVLFSGMAFEGNGGAGDVVSDQSTSGAHANVLFNSVAFERTTAFGPTVGYGTNNVSITGTQYARYTFKGCSFQYGVGYTPSGTRPNISASNTAAIVATDTSNIFFNNVEAPASQIFGIGEPGQSVGCIIFGASAGGAGSLVSPASLSNRVWTLPDATGIVQVDTATAWQTYTPTVTFGAGSATFTAAGRYRNLGNKTFAAEVNVNISAIGSATGSISVSAPPGGTAGASMLLQPGSGIDATNATSTPFYAVASSGFTFFFGAAPIAHNYFGNCVYETT